MRRHVLLTVPALAAMWLSSALPGYAADQHVVVSRQGLPSSLSSLATDCASGATDVQLTHVRGPGNPPRGKGSLRLHAGGETLVSFGRAMHRAPASKLRVFRLASIQSSDARAEHSYAEIVTARPGVDGNDLLDLELPSAHSWRGTDVLHARLTWRHATLTGTTSMGSGTWSQYRSAHPGAEVVDVEVGLLNCGDTAPVTFHVDAFRVNSTIYDFEHGPAAHLRITAPDNAATGEPVVVRGGLRGANGVPLVGERVELWAATAGGSFRRVAVRSTADDGRARARVTQTASTTYEWRYGGNLDWAPARSDRERITTA